MDGEIKDFALALYDKARWTEPVNREKTEVVIDNIRFSVQDNRFEVTLLLSGNVGDEVREGLAKIAQLEAVFKQKSNGRYRIYQRKVYEVLIPIKAQLPR